MDIDIAIDKLKELKKLSAKIGECELVDLSSDSFIFKVNIGDKHKKRAPIGFNCTSTTKKTA